MHGQQNIKFAICTWRCQKQTAETCCSRCTQGVQNIVFALLVRTDIKNE